MNERTWWSANVKPKWHAPLKNWLAKKIQDSFFKGQPDVLAMAEGRVALIELKYEPELPHDALKTKMFVDQSVKPKGKGLSVEQRNNLEEWQNAGGRAWVFFGVHRNGYLLTVDQLILDGMTMQYLEDAAIVTCRGYKEFDKVMVHLQHGTL